MMGYLSMNNYDGIGTGGSDEDEKTTTNCPNYTTIAANSASAEECSMLSIQPLASAGAEQTAVVLPVTGPRREGRGAGRRRGRRRERSVPVPLLLNDEQRARLVKTLHFCFSSLLYFDAALIDGKKFTSTSQMRATTLPPARLLYGKLPPLVIDKNVLPNAPVVYGRTSSSIWGETHPYLELCLNLHYAWRLLNHEECYAVMLRYGFKRTLSEIAYGLGYKHTRSVNDILLRATDKLAPALLDLVLAEVEIEAD
jgi:hypothetical protein